MPVVADRAPGTAKGFDEGVREPCLAF